MPNLYEYDYDLIVAEWRNLKTDYVDGLTARLKEKGFDPYGEEYVQVALRLSISWIAHTLTCCVDEDYYDRVLLAIAVAIADEIRLNSEEKTEH